MKLKLKTKELQEALKALDQTKSKWDLANVLGSICFTAKGDKLELASTDGTILQKTVIDIHSDPIETRFMVEPTKALLKTLSGFDSEYITLEIGEGVIIFSCHSANVSTQLIEGNYPNYEQLLPEAEDTDFLLDVDINLLEKIVKSAKAIKDVDLGMVLSLRIKTMDTTRVNGPIAYSIKGLEGVIMPYSIKDKPGIAIKPVEALPVKEAV